MLFSGHIQYQYYCFSSLMRNVSWPSAFYSPADAHDLNKGPKRRLLYKLMVLCMSSQGEYVLQQGKGGIQKWEMPTFQMSCSKRHYTEANHNQKVHWFLYKVMLLSEDVNFVRPFCQTSDLTKQKYQTRFAAPHVLANASRFACFCRYGMMKPTTGQMGRLRHLITNRW